MRRRLGLFSRGVLIAAAGPGLVSCGSGDDTTTVTPVTVDATADAPADGPDKTVDARAMPTAEAGEAGADAGSAVDGSASPESDAGCLVDAGPLDDAMVTLGHQIVTAHRCTLCHGDTLSGNFDGVVSPTVIGGRAYPPNLTSDPATGLGCWTNEQIEEAMLFGIDNQGMPLCAPMPVFGRLLDGGLDLTAARAVVAYLRSLPVVSEQVPDTPDCPVPGADAMADAAPDVASIPDATLEASAESGTDASPDGAEDAGLEAGSD